MIDRELRVRVLGGAEPAVDGRPLVELASAKAAALVIYLTVTGTAHSRSALAGPLWSDLPEAAARTNLRLVLTKLRRVLPEHLVVTRPAIAVTGPAAGAAAAGRAAGRARHDPSVQIWGLTILIETALRRDPADPALAQWSREAAGLLPHVARIDAARVHVAAARLHLAAGRSPAAWQAVRTADRLLGPDRAVEQYALEALAGVPEIGLALAEAGSRGPGEPDRAELRPLTVSGLRRLRRYARTYPIARPRALLCLGRLAWLDGRTTTARRAWSRALREAERLRMPYEVAWAHLMLGRHLTPGRLSPLGLDREQHLAKATSGFCAIGCRTP